MARLITDLSKESIRDKINYGFLSRIYISID